MIIAVNKLWIIDGFVKSPYAALRFKTFYKPVSVFPYFRLQPWQTGMPKKLCLQLLIAISWGLPAFFRIQLKPMLAFTWIIIRSCCIAEFLRYFCLCYATCREIMNHSVEKTGQDIRPLIDIPGHLFLLLLQPVEFFSYIHRDENRSLER
jgi:hypothetical protein